MNNKTEILNQIFNDVERAIQDEKFKSFQEGLKRGERKMAVILKIFGKDQMEKYLTEHYPDVFETKK